jgi:hypothetical protein
VTIAGHAEVDRIAVRAALDRARGIAYLLDEQRADGSWPHRDSLQAIVPPENVYILAEVAKHYPVEALAHFLAAAE